MKPEVVVFSSKKALLSKLDTLERSRSFTYTAESPESIKKHLSTPGNSVLTYLDASDFSEKEIEKLIASKPDHLQFGVIDTSGTIIDPARLMRLGAVDYIGKGLLQVGITGKRIKSIIDFCHFPVIEPEDASSSLLKSGWKLSGSSWQEVKSGQEYTFCFMFVEIDLIDEWKQKSGRAHLDEVKDAFQKHIQHFAEQLSGKIWMWMDLGGLILFPFDGESCAPILDGLRMVLNRTIISAEYYRYNTLISYRIALHIGDTIYKKRGNTATIVSDSVNFLFHLGRQFAQSGNFYLTEPVMPFIPEGLKDCFVPLGEFEDVPVCRMRLPVI